jgi:O-antigen/teichoic acid export membrane protein
MTADAKHRLGTILMWSGVGLAVVATLAAVPRWPIFGLSLLAASIALTVAGAWIKKRSCPRCREGACEMPPDRP